MGIFSKTTNYLKERLSKTRDKISSSLMSVIGLGRNIDDELLNKLEETLISDDIGVETTEKLIGDLREAYKSRRIEKTDDILPFLKEHIKNYWPAEDRQINFTTRRPLCLRKYC